MNARATGGEVTLNRAGPEPPRVLAPLAPLGALNGTLEGRTHAARVGRTRSPSALRGRPAPETVCTDAVAECKTGKDHESLLQAESCVLFSIVNAFRGRSLLASSRGS